MIKNQYILDETSHPGIVVEDYLEGAGMSLPAFAGRMGITPETANRLIAGEERVTPALAASLSRVLGHSPRLWSNLQRLHDETKARIAAEKYQNGASMAAESAG